MITGAVTINFAANTADFEKGVEKSKGLIGDLKSSLGKGSTLGQSMKILAGGGAVAGFAMIGRELEALTGKAIEFRDAMREGKMEAGDVVEELAKSLPIYGGVIAAGRNIRELITGEQAAITAIEQSATAANAKAKAYADSMKTVADYHRATLEYLAQMEIKYQAIGASPFLQKQAQQLLQRRAENRALETEREDQVKKINDEFAPALKAAQEKLAAAQNPANQVVAPTFGHMGGFAPSDPVLTKANEAYNEIEKIKRERAKRIAAIDADVAAKSRAQDKLYWRQTYQDYKEGFTKLIPNVKKWVEGIAAAAEFGEQFHQEKRIDNALSAWFDDIEQNGEKWVKKIDDVTKDAATPMQVFGEKMSDAMKMLDTGAIDQQTYDQYVDRISKEAVKAQMKDVPKMPELKQLGKGMDIGTMMRNTTDEDWKQKELKLLQEQVDFARMMYEEGWA